MSVSVRARLMAGYLVLVVVVGGATGLVIERSLADALIDELDERLETQARGVAQWLERAGHPENLAPRLARVVAARVTIVGPDGVIRGDSADRKLKDRPVGDAPEVSAARTSGVGRARRALDPGGAAMYLVAVRTDDGGAIRVAVPLARITDARAELRARMLVASVIGLGAAILLGVAAVRAVTRPLQAMTRTAERLRRGDYDVDAADDGASGPQGSADELGLLSRTLRQLAGELKARIGELTAERDLSTAVVEALAEGVIAVDAGGQVVLANRAAEVLLGDAGAPLPPALAALVDGARQGRDRDAEIEVAARVVQVAARPLPATGGAVAVLSDVTQLRALDRVRREFLASAAHELRTPVTAISGYAETLLAGAVDPSSQREFLATIHRNAARIARLVADLLTLERLEARPERLADRTAVAVAPVVAHVVATARAAAAGADVAIRVDVPDDLAILGARDGLEHVLQNLVDNAVRHGGAEVRVSARRVGRRVELEVADDGPGIAPEHRARIFERFYRVDAGRSRDRGGSGLGLAIVDQHVAAMGGTVRVASEPGAGARFVVELDAAGPTA